jgi:murein L,D-transpeptidase YafK
MHVVHTLMNIEDRMVKFSTIAVLLAYSFATFANEFLPQAIYQLDNKFTHHVLVVEKSTHKLLLYENNKSEPKLIKVYNIATGKVTGNKEFQGDKKTPEGIYSFQNFHSRKFLIDKYGKEGLIYGAGAFTMNYPNVIDRRNGKTGGGIWLHSAENDSRVNKNLVSRGCVVAKDFDLKEISQYIDLKNTQIIVTHNISFIRKETWLKNKEEISNTIVNWAKSWQAKDFSNYIEQYSKKEFHSESKGNFYGYKAYKQAVFSRPGNPQINFRNISILNNKNYAVVTLEQSYKSDIIEDIGKKVLYLKRNSEYKWKIVSETWSRLPSNNSIAFTPKMRFFTDSITNNDQVKNDSGSI